MKTLTKLLLATVLASTAASSVFANTQFDVDIYRPNPNSTNNALDAYAREPAGGLRSAPRPVRPFSIEEQLWFDRASSPKNS